MADFVSVEMDQARLNRAMGRFLAQQVPAVRDVVVRSTALEIVALVTRSLNGVAGLPKRIDTGRLRAGWRIALSSIGFATTGIDAPGSSDPQNRSQGSDGSGEYTHNADKSIALVSNNVRYARFVEDGTAKMRPGHHLKRALRLAAREFEESLARAIKAQFVEDSP